MPYLASWSVFIDGDDLTPVEVARQALTHQQEPTWKVIDLDSGQTTVVDINSERVLFQSEIRSSNDSRVDRGSGVGDV